MRVLFTALCSSLLHGLLGAFFPETQNKGQTKQQPPKPAAKCVKKPHSIITGFITSQVYIQWLFCKKKMLHILPHYSKHLEIWKDLMSALLQNH